MTFSLAHPGIISIFDLSEKDMMTVLDRADQLKKKQPKNLLQGSILASCFFEPSTRTRLSFESAMLRLGGSVIGFSDSENTSFQKGRIPARFDQSHRTICGYHRSKTSHGRICPSCEESTDKPVINAGDGANQHPSQTLIDLFTIRECQGKLNSLNIAMVGDLKYGRTIHSLALACALFDVRLFFISPDQLTIPDYILHELRKKCVKFSFHRTIEEVMPKLDILYMTRIQKGRFQEGEYERLKNHFVLKKSTLKSAKKNLKILHPLPRLNEIEIGVDDTDHAYYFQQVVNGVFVRQAILALLLKK